MSVMESLTGWVFPTAPRTDGLPDLRESVRQGEETIGLLQETVAELELAMEDIGWQRLTADGSTEFSRSGLGRAAALARLYWIKNPLIRRAVAVKTYYVWGQGVQVAARDETVNDLVQGFLDDEGNLAEMFGQSAREEKERELCLDANLFLVLFTRPVTGTVQVRSVPLAEITDIIRNPDDRREPWYYVRTWTEERFDPETGATSTVGRTAYYPDFRYLPAPATRKRTINGNPVYWGSPIKHVKVGGLGEWKFGLSEMYPALDWARAYKEFLEDWASVVKALSRFSWNAKTKTSKVGTLRTTLQESRANADGTGPARAGAAFVNDGLSELTAISKSGATIDAMSGRPLAMMVAAAVDMPYTILMGDPDIGNLATAKTLDRPTELAMLSRQALWSSVIEDLCNYVVDQAVRAPRGPLAGTIARDEDGRETVVLAGDVDRTVEVTWPAILDDVLKDTIEAIAKADATGKVPAEVILRLLLAALGVPDADEIVTQAELAAQDAADEQAAEREVVGVVAEALNALREAVAARPVTTTEG